MARNMMDLPGGLIITGLSDTISMNLVPVRGLVALVSENACIF
jgi:hypothetical protein